MQTGYGGRTALTEMLVVNEAIRDAALQKRTTRSLQEVAVAEGMQTLWKMGLRRVVKGESPLEEIVRVVGFDHS
jgi:type II secretory ATPase GspE/PulE/Tfp pilus assembly ATPase PilB-like protein